MATSPSERDFEYAEIALNTADECVDHDEHRAAAAFAQISAARSLKVIAGALAELVKQGERTNPADSETETNQ